LLLAGQRDSFGLAYKIYVSSSLISKAIVLEIPGMLQSVPHHQQHHLRSQQANVDRPVEQAGSRWPVRARGQL
jgi:hypothetical protein